MRRFGLPLVLLFAASLLPLPGVASQPAPNQVPEPRAPRFPDPARTPPAGLEGRPEHVSGELIVRFETGVGAARRSQIHEGLARRVVRDLLLSRTQLVRLRKGLGVEAAIAAYERNPNVAFAEPNVIYRATAVPDDPDFGQLWGLHNTGQTVNGQPGAPDADIDAPEAWDTLTGSPAVTVGVVDTGIALQHPDLAPNIWVNPGEIAGNGIDDDGNGRIDDVNGYDFANNDADPTDDQLHGTHVTGTLGAAGNNALGVTGVTWDVQIAALKALDHLGSGTAADIADAFAYAGAMGFDIVNASLSGPGFSFAMDAAIGAAPNTLFVVAAGNDGTNNDTAPASPCSLTRSNIICVAATTQADGLAPFSNRGATSVDLGAPGVNIRSTFPALETPLPLQDFEAENPFTAGTWSQDPTGTWDRVLGVSGNHWIHDSPVGNYPNNANTWAQRVDSFDLSGDVDGCRLEYFLRLSTELGFDFLHVEASGDNVSWTPLDMWSGSTGGAFFFLASDLSDFEGDPSVWVRFRLTSNPSGTADGAHVDNVEVVCVDPDGPYDANDYEFLDGTSMATPHVAGAAALLMGASPSATVGAVRSAILGSVDPLPALASTTASGGRLNLRAALDALLAPPPPPEKAPKTLVLRAKPKIVPAGAKTRLKARIKPCGHHAGMKVTFQKKKNGGGWKKIDAKNTNTNCVAKIRKRVTKTTRFRARVGADTDHLAAISNKRKVRVV